VDADVACRTESNKPGSLRVGTGDGAVFKKWGTTDDHLLRSHLGAPPNQSSMTYAGHLL